MRALPFKYPMDKTNAPAPLPADVAPRTSSRDLGDDDVLAAVHAWFAATPPSDDALDLVYETMGGADGGLSRSTFETRSHEVAILENPDIESDPVLEWDGFLAACARRRDSRGVS